MSYNVLFKNSASKQFRRMPKNMLGKVASAIDELAEDSRPVNCKKLKDTTDTYRIRIGDYRVIYTIDDSIVTVEVVKVGNWKDVYE